MYTTHIHVYGRLSTPLIHKYAHSCMFIRIISYNCVFDICKVHARCISPKYGVFISCVLKKKNPAIHIRMNVKFTYFFFFHSITYAKSIILRMLTLSMGCENYRYIISVICLYRYMYMICRIILYFNNTILMIYGSIIKKKK